MKLLSYILTILISLVLPIGAAIFLASKKKGWLKPILLGALTFVVFQMIIRIPILQLVLPTMPWYIKMTYSQPILTALFLGGTASLFENGGRYLIMKLFMKNRQKFTDGVAFGIGHGGIEAILFVGINVLVAFIIYGASENAGLIFASGVERLSAMIMHVAWSVMILKSIREKKIGWLIVAFALHMFIDTVAVIILSYNVSILIMETGIAAFAVAMLVFILIECKKATQPKQSQIEKESVTP